jgi:hypothetical protein
LLYLEEEERRGALGNIVKITNLRGKVLILIPKQSPEGKYINAIPNILRLLV